MGALQQSPWQQWLLIHKQAKQQWITSNQAQSAEGVIMHSAAAPLSLCKPSLSLPLSLSLSLSQLRAEWLICDYWFLANVGGIESERRRSSILRSVLLQLLPLGLHLKRKKTNKWKLKSQRVQSLAPNHHPSPGSFCPPCPASLCLMPPKSAVNIQEYQGKAGRNGGQKGWNAYKRKKRHKTFAPLKVHKLFSSKNIMKPRGQPLAPFHYNFKHFPSQQRREISWIIWI